MAKSKKAPKIEIIKCGFEPNNTVTMNSVMYSKLPNGNYLNQKTKKEVKLVK